MPATDGSRSASEAVSRPGSDCATSTFSTAPATFVKSCETIAGIGSGRNSEMTIAAIAVSPMPPTMMNGSGSTSGRLGGAWSRVSSVADIGTILSGTERGDGPHVTRGRPSGRRSA